MSSIMTVLLFWIMFVHKQECAVIRPDRYNRKTFEYVIQKYMNPLRRLSADLPNHAIEMEIEIHGSVPREVKHTPQRRVIRVVNARHPKKILRIEDPVDGTEDIPLSELGAAGQTNQTAVEDPSLVASTTATTAPPPANPTPADPGVPAPADSAKIPVFMEDLKKALDEFEKKLQATLENTTKKQAGEETSPVPAAPVRSIDDLVQMLKKAQQLNANVEHRLPKAGDEKLEWLQIKIPKNAKT